jgi:hypothetical protein
MRLGVLLFSAIGAACSTTSPPTLPVLCREIPWESETEADAGADTLRIIVHVDSIPRDAFGEALVRVDPLGAGHVAFESPPPPTAAAVSATFTLTGVFHGCFAEDPAAVFVRTPAAPQGKAWLRISADRTVSVRVETGEPGPRSKVVSGWIVVEPGESGRGRWSVDGAP